MAYIAAPTRSWTDDQLRAAVEAQTTWKGVASALELSQSSTPRLKRHAARLGLDTSTWQIIVGRRPYVRDKSAQRVPYDPDELDYYFIVDGDGALYLIPSSVLGGRTRINIGAYAAYRVGDASSLLAEAA